MQKKQMQIRMDDKMRDRVHKYVDNFWKKTHAKISFSEAVRVLLDSALDHAGIK